MRSHAKAPSAFTFGRKGVAASALIALALAALFALAMAPSASATKYVDSYFGNPVTEFFSEGSFLFYFSQAGSEGGLFADGSGAGGVGVNDSTGDIYVVDRGNHRIQQFDADNAFVRAWGQDVVGGNERQTVTVRATAGQYKLKFAGSTTNNIAFNASAAIVDNALDALPSIGGDANVAVTGGFAEEGGTRRTYTVTFTGKLAATDVEQLTSEEGTTPLSGGTGVTIATLANGFGGAANTGFEFCTVAAECKAGTATGTGGAFSTPEGIALNQSTGHLYVTDGANRRVQEFDEDGNFIRAWGQDVVKTGAPNDFGTSAFEVCDTTAGNAAADCKAGASGTQGGAFATTFTGYPAVVPAGAPNAGNVLVADPGNRRVQEFTSIGTFVRAFGWDVVQPGGTGEAFGPLLNERQRVSLSAGAGFFTVIGGTFKLTFDGQQTEAIKFNASGAEVEAELVALSNIAPGDISVGGPNKGPWDINFAGAFAGVNVPQMTGDPSQLQSDGGPPGFLTEVNVSTPQEGGPGPAFEICMVAAQCKVGLAGSAVGQFSSGNPKQIAADATGAVYANETGGSASNTRVQKFSGPSLTPALFANDLLGVPGTDPPSALAYDPANDRVLVAAQRTLPPGTCAQNLPQTLIFELTTSGTLEDTHGSCTTITSEGRGLAVRPSNGRLYLAATGAQTFGEALTVYRVWAYDDDGFGPATVELDPPSEVTAHTARVTGTVTPNGPVGISTGYRFQYSRNGVTWTDANSEVKIGDGSSPVAIGPITITGLEAGSFYRVRLITNKGFGNPEDVSPELTFATDGVAPEVQTRYPQSHTDTTARLTGELNANNLPTKYHFEYGTTTAYGNVAPVPDGSASSGVSELVFAEIEGLQPATTYHYRLVATNAEGTTKGDDVAFTTYAAGASAKPQRAYEMMTPPFKVVRAPTSFGGAVGNNPNPGVPSLDGNAMLWTTSIFPLTDDVRAAQGGDRRYLERSAAGWTFETQNTLTARHQIAGVIDPNQGTLLSRTIANASSGDLKTVTMRVDNATLLPNEGWGNIIPYTFRKGTGTAGYTSWVTNTDGQVNPGSEITAADSVKLNDEGTVMLRWGGYFDVAEDPSTPWDDDPTGEQTSGRSLYLVRAASPEELPTAPRDVVAECTGTGAEATEVINRVGTGSSSTDTIGAQSCEEAPTTPAATGAGTRTAGSSTLTNVTTASGAFSVGQIISGTGIPRGARITSVGADSLTLSVPSENPICVAKGDNIRTVAGSPVIIARPICGAFEAGQAVTGTGIPGGTTIVAVDRYELTLSANATETGFNGEIIASTPGPTALTANAQHVTSTGGADAGGVDGAVLGTVSNDGNRTFFMSPSSANNSNFVDKNCEDGTGLNTVCPPQLFVRQYDSEGNPTVRWISRAQGIATQQIGLIGEGSTFEGASRDGRHVYFKTNAPLLPTDPNAGSSITTGTSQESSWDLYRYTLPESLDEDPANGTLFRITGGPSGSADPNTNNIKGGALRYFSDDGRRAYFVTRAEIPGAINSPPSGGSTAPSGAVDHTTTRNLYLFDETGGSPQWRFIARLPHGTVTNPLSPESLNGCASFYTGLGGGHIGIQSGQERHHPPSNCFRGTPDGSAVIFFTRGQLTADDRDEAGDIYLYDAETNELTRVSAPRNDSEPYSCARQSESEVGGYCNADLGIKSTGGGGFSQGAGGLDSARGWGGGRQYNIGQDANGTIRVFFESESELIPEDVNGEHMDVYEWSNGRLSLVSPGNTPDQSFFSGNSVDGRDVFLFTGARIDPREIDDSDYDLYDVRIGGGFPYTPPPTPCDVLAHECRPNALPAAAPRSAASSSFAGDGNVAATPRKKARRCGKGKVRRKGRCVRKQQLRKKRSAAKKKRANSQTGRASR